MATATTTTTTTHHHREPFPFHAVTKEECYKYLQVGGTSSTLEDDDHVSASISSYERDGLTTAQVLERRAMYGDNALSPTTPKTIWQRIWYQIANVLVVILMVVAVVAAAQAIRFATMEPPDRNNVTTQSIQVVLLVSLIMYVRM